MSMPRNAYRVKYTDWMLCFSLDEPVGDMYYGGSTSVSHLVINQWERYPLCDVILSCNTNRTPPAGAIVDINYYAVNVVGFAGEDEGKRGAGGKISGCPSVLCSALLDSSKGRGHVHLMQNIPAPQSDFIVDIMPLVVGVKSGARVYVRLHTGGLAK